MTINRITPPEGAFVPALGDGEKTPDFVKLDRDFAFEFFVKGVAITLGAMAPAAAVIAGAAFFNPNPTAARFAPLILIAAAAAAYAAYKKTDIHYVIDTAMQRILCDFRFFGWRKRARTAAFSDIVLICATGLFFKKSQDPDTFSYYLMAVLRDGTFMELGDPYDRTKNGDLEKLNAEAKALAAVTGSSWVECPPFSRITAARRAEGEKALEFTREPMSQFSAEFVREHVAWSFIVAGAMAAFWSVILVIMGFFVCLTLAAAYLTGAF